MVSPWYRHAVAMVSPCYRHAIAMLSPCYRHGIAMGSPWYRHGIAMLSPCCRHGCHAIATLGPRYRHAIVILPPRLSSCYSILQRVTATTTAESVGQPRSNQADNFTTNATTATLRLLPLPLPPLLYFILRPIARAAAQPFKRSRPMHKNRERSRGHAGRRRPSCTPRTRAPLSPK